MSLLDEVWIARKDGLLEVPEAQTFVSYATPYFTQLLGKNTVPKVGVGALVAAGAQIGTAFSTVLWFVVGAWAVDFALGVLRALADPEVELRADKARNGIMRLLVIPLLAIIAAILEGMTFELVGWNPAGTFVTTVCVAMFWEECVSIQRNGRHFYRSLRLRINSAPWFGDGKD